MSKRKLHVSIFVILTLCLLIVGGKKAFILWHLKVNRFDLQKLKQQGYELVNELNRADSNIRNQNKKILSVWPNSNNNFSNSTDYFKHLMDVDNYGTDKWEPVLSGSSVYNVFYNVNPESLEKETIWSIAKNINEIDDPNIPVLISRNFDVTQLRAKYSKKDQEIITKNYGGYVLIRKDGSIYSQVRPKVTLNHIYRGKFFDYSTNAVCPAHALKYLTPKNEVFPQQD